MATARPRRSLSSCSTKFARRPVAGRCDKVSHDSSIHDNFCVGVVLPSGLKPTCYRRLRWEGAVAYWAAAALRRICRLFGCRPCRHRWLATAALLNLFSVKHPWVLSVISILKLVSRLLVGYYLLRRTYAVESVLKERLGSRLDLTRLAYIPLMIR